jgi:nucleotide-binding universal stress UspA family protein
LITPQCEPISDAQRTSIIVPLDGSHASEAALPSARAIGALLNAALILVQSIEPYRAFEPGSQYSEGDFYTRNDLAEARRYLEDLATDLRAEHLLVRTRTAVGNPAQAVVSIARDEHAAAIVMTSSGRGGLARLVPGSVAQETIERTTCPVVLVRAPAAELAQVASPASVDIQATRTLCVTRRELDLLERGLGELLYPPSGASRHAPEIRALLARLTELDLEPAAGSSLLPATR